MSGVEDIGPLRWRRAWADPFVYRMGPFRYAVVFSAIGGNTRPDIVYRYRLKRRAYAATVLWAEHRRGLAWAREFARTEEAE